MTAYTGALPPVRLRGGVSYWLESYRALTRWHLASLRMWLMLLTVVQIMAGVPVINLVVVGLIMGPQLVAQQKMQQSYDFMRALPVPQTSAAAAWYTVCLLAGSPAVVVSLLIAEARYGITFAVSPAIVPAVLLTAFTGTIIGYGLGHAVPNPMVTNLVTELLIFAVFGFAPILFPRGSCRPGWPR